MSQAMSKTVSFELTDKEYEEWVETKEAFNETVAPYVSWKVVCSEGIEAIEEQLSEEQQ
jgi:hypothetical protein